jgi:hypothetical protein
MLDAVAADLAVGVGFDTHRRFGAISLRLARADQRDRNEG